MVQVRSGVVYAAKPVPAMTVGQDLAQLVADEPAVRRLWVGSVDGIVELWLLVEPIDVDTELRLYGAGPTLYERYPHTHIRFHLLNPRYFEQLDPELVIPPGAREIAMHSA